MIAHGHSALSLAPTTLALSSLHAVALKSAGGLAVDAPQVDARPSYLQSAAGDSGRCDRRGHVIAEPLLTVSG